MKRGNVMERTRRSEFKTCFICNAICTLMSYNVYKTEKRLDRSAEMNMLLEQRAEQ